MAVVKADFKFEIDSLSWYCILTINNNPFILDIYEPGWWKFLEGEKLVSNGYELSLNGNTLTIDGNEYDVSSCDIKKIVNSIIGKSMLE